MWYTPNNHYNDLIMSTMASQITSLTIVYSSVLFRRRSKKTSKLRVTGLCEGNSSVTGEFPAQRASKAENVSIRWRHHIAHISVFVIGLLSIDIANITQGYSHGTMSSLNAREAIQNNIKNIIHRNPPNFNDFPIIIFPYSPRSASINKNKKRSACLSGKFYTPSHLYMRKAFAGFRFSCGINRSL